MKSKNRGFTLIELLVVIAIIGLLSSVVLASLNQTRLKGNDSKRIQSAKQIQSALELYRSKNGSYPISTSHTSHCSTWGGSGTAWSSSSGLTSLVTQGFISALPVDPETNGIQKCCYLYRSTASGSDYKFMVAYGSGSSVCTNVAYTAYPTFFDPARDASNSGCAVNFGGTDSPYGLNGTRQPVDWAIYTSPGGCTL
ncbi:MAG: prepilin-type N-terminal cleavage/methylation domain-containing protein [Minisyncoccia bacterium]